jgi:glycine/D-amino acid oxidase-like deaminating enzyme
MTTPLSDSLWLKTVPHDLPYSPLDREITADVVVIGGGFTGVSAAFHLADSGASVCLLEAETIGFGGSGRNVGLVNAGLWTPPDEVETTLGPQIGKHLNAYLAGGPDAVFDLIERLTIDCAVLRNGTLHCAHSASGLQNLRTRHAQQLARNAPVQLLDASETARRTGSNAFHGALWDARAGTIQPLAYVRGLARAAATKGAQIFENSAAQKVTQTNGLWTVETAQGRVSAPKLIQATNAYGSAGASRNSFILAHYFQLATAPLPQSLRDTILMGGEGCWDTALIMSSFRLDAQGRLVLGALGNLDGIGRSAHRAWARRKLTALFPQLSDIKLEMSWTGRISMTSSHLPQVQSLGANGVSIFGYSGRGIGPGTLFGRAAAQWAAGTGSFPIPITEPAAEPLPTLKSAFYEAGAALTHLINSRL